jgi:hypothetical protein
MDKQLEAVKNAVADQQNTIERCEELSASA